MRLCCKHCVKLKPFEWVNRAINLIPFHFRILRIIVCSLQCLKMVFFIRLAHYIQQGTAHLNNFSFNFFTFSAVFFIFNQSLWSQLQCNVQNHFILIKYSTLINNQTFEPRLLNVIMSLKLIRFYCMVWLHHFIQCGV